MNNNNSSLTSTISTNSNQSTSGTSTISVLQNTTDVKNTLPAKMTSNNSNTTSNGSNSVTIIGSLTGSNSSNQSLILNANKSNSLTSNSNIIKNSLTSTPITTSSLTQISNTTSNNNNNNSNNVLDNNLSSNLSKLSTTKINQFPSSNSSISITPLPSLTSNSSNSFSSTSSVASTLNAANTSSSSSTQINPLNNNTNGTQPNNQIAPSQQTNTTQISGFARCYSCNEYGVKAAFYGKSKLYCSVACQNGIKKQQQQQQQNHGVKRTIDAVNHSPLNANINSQHSNNQNAQMNSIHPNSNITTNNSSNTSNLILVNSNNVSSNSTIQIQNSSNNIQQLPSINTITLLPLTNTNTNGNAVSNNSFIPANTTKTNTSINSNLINIPSIQQTISNISNNNPSLVANNVSSNTVQTLNNTNGSISNPITAGSSLATSSLNKTTPVDNLSSTKQVNSNESSKIDVLHSNSTSNSTNDPLNSFKSQQIPNQLTIKPTNSQNNDDDKNINKINYSNSLSSTISGVIEQLESTQNPPSKRARLNSVSSTASNSGSSSSSSSKQETKSNDNTTNLTSKNSSIAKVNSFTSNNNSQEIHSSSSSNIKISPSSSVKISNNFSNGLKQNSFDWPSYIDKENAVAAPVHFFKHAPLNYNFEYFTTKIKVEVELPKELHPPASSVQLDAKFSNKPFFWYASIVKFAGYFAKFRFIGYENDASADFWMHLCDSNIHSVGYANENEIPIVAPFCIYRKITNLFDYLRNQLINSDSLPTEFADVINESKASKFKKGMILELVDKKKLSCMRVARIINNIGGRLHLKYENTDEFDDFWCHEQSELIHPVGWSTSVGHDLHASDAYKKASLKNVEKNLYDSIKECSPSMFKKVRDANLKPFKVNMKLETIDPLCLSSIRVATVGKVLKNNYLMIRIDGAEENDMFCYHRSSPVLFPSGFCQQNKLTLHPPYGYQGSFTWEKYLKETNSEFAPYDLFHHNSAKKNPFEVGMKLESVDLMEPKMICVATVAAVVDRLILVSFDGWDNQFDQWVDCESCDIYPVGWSTLVGYNLEQIRKQEPENTATSKRKVRKSTAITSSRKKNN